MSIHDSSRARCVVKSFCDVKQSLRAVFGMKVERFVLEERSLIMNDEVAGTLAYFPESCQILAPRAKGKGKIIISIACEFLFFLFLFKLLFA